MDEKKKVIALCALFAVMLCVGAFQFLKASAGAPPVAKSGSSKTFAKDDAKDVVALNTTGLTELSNRDPFDAPYQPHMDKPMPRGIIHRENIAGSFPQMPDASQTKVAPITFKGLGVDPDPKVTSVPTTQTAPVIQPTFDYEVAGTMVGKRPLAVFKDKAGHERLVALGQRIDLDSRLIGVEMGRVTVSFRGRNLNLALEEGGTVAKP